MKIYNAAKIQDRSYDFGKMTNAKLLGNDKKAVAGQIQIAENFVDK